MFWKERKDNDDGTIEHKTQVVERTIRTARELILPHMQDFETLSDEDKRERISTLILAMGYAQAVFAQVFFKVTPEEFGHQMGRLVSGTLRTIEEHGPSAAEMLGLERKDETSSWD